jgi:hypothetical protein
MMGLIYVNLLLQNKAPAIHVGVLVFSSRVYFYLEWTCVVCLREKGNARAERAGTGEGYHPSAQKWKTGRGFYTVFWTPFVVSLIAYGISIYHIRPLQEEAAHSIEYAVLVVLSCFPAITRLYLLGRNAYFLRWLKVPLSEAVYSPKELELLEEKYLNPREGLLPGVLNKKGIDVYLQESAFLRSRQTLGGLLLYIPRLFNAYEDEKKKKEREEKEKDTEMECVDHLIKNSAKDYVALLERHLIKVPKKDEGVIIQKFTEGLQKWVDNYREEKRRMEP